MEEKEVVRSLSALAHGARLQVFRALVVAGSHGMTPGVMAEVWGIPPATLSFHLKESMNAAGSSRRSATGCHLIYRVLVEHMNALLGYLTANCCQGEACLDETAASCNC